MRMPGLGANPTGDLFQDHTNFRCGDVDMQYGALPESDVEEYESELEEEDDFFCSSHSENVREPNDSRSSSPDLVFAEGHFDEPLQLPHSRPPPPTTPDCIREPHVVYYPDPCAGAPIPLPIMSAQNHQYAQTLEGQHSNPWAPFVSETDWKVAHWAKMRGPSSTALSEVLAIDGVAEKLGLSYRNAKELNAMIDKKLPAGRPQFQRQEVIVQGEVFEVYFRHVLECIKDLFGDAEFAEYLKFAPERHFENDKCDEQLYHDMHTGKWWWLTQEKLDKNAGCGRTVVPIILSTDKTQVTVFRNKSVYPVYMSIGNIPKEIRRKPSHRAYILLGYLPTTNLSHIKNAASRRRSIANLFHTLTGVIMASGDGIQRLVHPIFAAHIGDYPEQILVTCCITGYCPCCTIPRQRIGENTEPHPLRHLRSILEALHMADQGAAAFVEACRKAGIKPIFEPYWSKLPYSNVYLAITPDILHQLYQGVFKHMKNWVIEAYGTHEIDARCRCLPPNHNVHVFMKGISSLQRVSGAEHAQISHICLGLVAEVPLADGICLCGLLDFLFLAQYPAHSTTSLGLLSDALDRFHTNKDIFIDLGIRSNFHIPKIHSMNHYVDSIKRMGTLDNFNTEYTERLHIDMAKEAYGASNKKDELLQMTRWLERKEKVMKHSSYISWHQAGQHPPLRTHWIPPGLNTTRIQKLTKNPSIYRVSVENVIQHYGATFFKAALARYVVQLTQPHLTGPRLDDEASGMFLGVSHVSVYHRIKYLQHDFFTGVSSTADSIHIRPAQLGKDGKMVPGRFDTALVCISDSEKPLKLTLDTRIARVRLVFTLPEQRVGNLSLFDGISEDKLPRHLAYVEWFSSFPASPDPNHHLYKVSHCEVEGGRLASIVDVRRLIRSVHLFPKFGSEVVDRTWKSSTVLDECKTFFVNSDSDRHMYQLFKN
ncbi:hypothetical protein DFJ43DRAFT_1134924 [Lentinula guzmanii]|uniref:Uncharacterized protein n=1 Tax=Lentinula guzmanii TaxID=2804957 RepID=A0AA38MUC5_9AGAR|nr:hypothetical protein DFJ43DRAFT_1134924 [Lentinula guzmanii]